MNFKRFHESKNLFDEDYIDISSNAIYRPLYVGDGYFTLSTTFKILSGLTDIFLLAGNVSSGINSSTNGAYDGKAITQQSINGYVTIAYRKSTRTGTGNITMCDTMLNSGSTALPYEPYGNTWTDIPHYIMGTSTDTLTTLPADIYANDATATVGLKGNMNQQGTPTPTTLIQPQECGDLETEGAHTGQYKIPILSANTTTPVYLGEVESTRCIKKLVLTGEEEWATVGTADIYGIAVSQSPITSYAEQMCSHFISASNWAEIVNNDGKFGISSPQNQLVIHYNASGSIPNFKSFLQQQYTNGTPVTIYYVLATPETAVVNEPLRKIGTYADEVANVSIPVIVGGDTISVDTQVQPSEVTATYKGWHSVADVHERTNGAWT